MQPGFPVAAPPPPVLGAGAESHGHHREPHGTHLTLTWEFELVPPASAVSADQQEAGLGVGEGPGVYLKTSRPPVQVCPPGWAILSLRSRGHPRQSFVGLAPHESWHGPLRCRACRPCTLQHCLRVQGSLHHGQRADLGAPVSVCLGGQDCAGPACRRELGGYNGRKNSRACCEEEVL